MNTRKTHCRRGHLMSPENTYIWKHTRRCRKCHALRQHRYQLLFLGLLLVGTTLAKAAPFLVSDPYVPQSDPNLNPTQFVIHGISGTDITINATTLTGGNLVLEYDLATLPNGTYHVTAAAVNIFGGESPFSTPPFDFTKGVPATPSGLRIVPTMLQ